jgi:hypothetical protein
MVEDIVVVCQPRDLGQPYHQIWEFAARESMDETNIWSADSVAAQNVCRSQASDKIIE